MQHHSKHSLIFVEINFLVWKPYLFYQMARPVHPLMQQWWPVHPLPVQHSVTGNTQMLDTYYRLGRWSTKSKPKQLSEKVAKSTKSARKQFRNMLRNAPDKSTRRQRKNHKSLKVKVQAKVNPISPPLCILVQQCVESKEVRRFIRDDMDSVTEDVLTRLPSSL